MIEYCNGLVYYILVLTWCSLSALFFSKHKVHYLKLSVATPCIVLHTHESAAWQEQYVFSLWERWSTTDQKRKITHSYHVFECCRISTGSCSCSGTKAVLVCDLLVTGDTVKTLSCCHWHSNNVTKLAVWVLLLSSIPLVMCFWGC